MSPSVEHLLKHGVVGALGLLVAGFAFETYHWYGYMQATPGTGSVSTSPGFRLFTAALFVVGVAVAYAAFARGLHSPDDHSTTPTAGNVTSDD